MSRLPVVSQEKVAELVGVTQAKVSRWEGERGNVEAPTLDQIGVLAELFDVDFIELAKLCGRWNDQIERRVLVSLARTGGDLSHAPLAQVAMGGLRRNVRPERRPVAA